MPFGGFLSKVDKRLDVPVRAHVLSSAIVGALGCLYLGSSTAFNRYVPAFSFLFSLSITFRHAKKAAERLVLNQSISFDYLQEESR